MNFSIFVVLEQWNFFLVFTFTSKNKILVMSITLFFFFKRSLGFVWLEEWKIGRVENCGRIEKWEDGKYLVFSLVCLVGGVEKWEGEKLFCLVGGKNGRMENLIYINWLLYPCYIISKKYIYLYSLNNIKLTTSSLLQNTYISLSITHTFLLK